MPNKGSPQWTKTAEENTERSTWYNLGDLEKHIDKSQRIQKLPNGLETRLGIKKRGATR